MNIEMVPAIYGLLNGNIYTQNYISFCSLFLNSNSCLNCFLLELAQVVNTRRDKGECSDSL